LRRATRPTTASTTRLRRWQPPSHPQSGEKPGPRRAARCAAWRRCAPTSRPAFADFLTLPPPNPRCPAASYLSERRLPDSAIDLIDEAAAKVALAGAGLAEAPRGGGGSGGSGAPAATRAPAAAEGGREPAASKAQQPSGGGTAGLGAFAGDVAQALSSSGDSGAAVSSQQPAAQQQQQAQPPESVGPHPQQQQQQQRSGQPAAAPSDGGRPMAGGRVSTWQDWVLQQGWSGTKEARRQQLLEWFGASPANPLPGELGEPRGLG
jgi:hypothetical protein